MATLTVTVRDGNQPVKGASVTITRANGTTKTKRTPANGVREFMANSPITEVVVATGAVSTPGPGPGPVPGWRPTRTDIRNYRGWFAVNQHDFTVMYAGQGTGTRQQWLDEAVARGDTHFLVSAKSQYRHTQVDLSRHPKDFADRVEEIYSRRLIPVLVVLPDHDSTQDPTNGNVLAPAAIRLYQDMLAEEPRLKEQIRCLVTGFEPNTRCTPEGQETLLTGSRRLWPHAYMGVSFSDDRWAGFAQKGTGPDGPTPPAWGSGDSGEHDFWVHMKQAGLADALYFQCTPAQHQSLSLLTHRLSELSVRLTGAGIPGFSAPYPPLGADLVLWETWNAELVLNGRGDLPQARRVGRAGLSVPGVIGAGDGF